MPDYYGTGKQPKTKKSYVGLAITLIVVLLAANAIPLLIPYLRSWDAPPEPDVPPQERSLQLPPENGMLPPEDGLQPPQQTAVCGMLICELDDVQQRYWDLPNGVIVGQVDAGGTASHAGILPGDVILRIGNAKPSSASECRTLLTSCKDGEQVQIEVYRSGETLEITLTCSADDGK